MSCQSVVEIFIEEALRLVFHWLIIFLLRQRDGPKVSLKKQRYYQAFQVNTVPAGNLYPSYSSSLINVVGAPKGAMLGRHLKLMSE
jgi:hypothetical protein